MILFSAGLTVFRGIYALDRDKPNTANSEISFEITGGNSNRKFSIEGSGGGRAVLVQRKKLDYDSGDRTFNLTIRAQVRITHCGRRVAMTFLSLALQCATRFY